jgi:hypothetical protein
MSYWNYRIVFNEETETWTTRFFAYDDEGDIVAISKTVASPRGETRDQFLEDIDRLTQATFDSPLFWYRDLSDDVTSEIITTVPNYRNFARDSKLEWSDGKSLAGRSTWRPCRSSSRS